MTRTPTDVAQWRNALIEMSTLENVRPGRGLLQAIELGPLELEVTLTTGERLAVPSSATRAEMASSISEVLGETVAANPNMEWPPYKTENFWWAETLYNFGVLAPNAIVIKPDVLFHRISRREGVATILVTESPSISTWRRTRHWSTLSRTFSKPCPLPESSGGWIRIRGPASTSM